MVDKYTLILWKEECLRSVNQPHQDSLPINDLFVLSSDEVVLLWGDDTQWVLLTRYGFCIYNICTEVHVHRSLR